MPQQPLDMRIVPRYLLLAFAIGHLLHLAAAATEQQQPSAKIKRQRPRQGPQGEYSEYEDYEREYGVEEEEENDDDEYTENGNARGEFFGRFIIVWYCGRFFCVCVCGTMRVRC